jgi:hypothetical protein
MIASSPKSGSQCKDASPIVHGEIKKLANHDAIKGTMPDSWSITSIRAFGGLEGG